MVSFGVIGIIIGMVETGYAVVNPAGPDMFMMVFGVMLLLNGFMFSDASRKTPVDIFKKAEKKKTPIMEIERKDGVIEFTNPEYTSGAVVDEKYGIFFVNDADVKTEKVSRAKIIHTLEGIGKTVDRRLIGIVHALKNDYGVNNWHDIMVLASLWRKCENTACNFEGPFQIDKKEEKNDRGESLGFTTIFKCPKCKTVGGLQLDPPLQLPLMENVEAGYMDAYFKENQNPLLQIANVDDNIRNRLDKEKKDTLMKVAMVAAIFTAIGIVIFMTFLGGSVFMQQMATQAAQHAPAVTPSIVG